MNQKLLGIGSVDDFNKVVAKIQSEEGYKPPQAFAIGLAHIGKSGKVLSVLYPHVNLNENFGTAAIFNEVVKTLFLPKSINSGGASLYVILESGEIDALLTAFKPFEGDSKEHLNIDAVKAVNGMSRKMRPYDGIVVPMIVFIYDLQLPPQSAVDAYLRLALMSYRKVQPNTVNLDGIFKLLTNNAWTVEEGPVEYEHFPKLNMEYMATKGRPLTIRLIDMFPPMTDLAWPSGVRICNPLMIRMGAHLAHGTTQMPYGYSNMNAGTLGKVLIEGNIPMGVTVDEGSDVGAGSGFLGTLSGGNKTKISVGKNCLNGAHAECGIPLGDNVYIDLGLCFTGNTPVKVIEWEKHDDGRFLTGPDNKPVVKSTKVVKASELSGISNVTFRRNSLNGAIEVIPVPSKSTLNDMLHIS